MSHPITQLLKRILRLSQVVCCYTRNDVYYEIGCMIVRFRLFWINRFLWISKWRSLRLTQVRKKLGFLRITTTPNLRPTNTEIFVYRNFFTWFFLCFYTTGRWLLVTGGHNNTSYTFLCRFTHLVRKEVWCNRFIYHTFNIVNIQMSNYELNLVLQS